MSITEETDVTEAHERDIGDRREAAQTSNGAHTMTPTPTARVILHLDAFLSLTIHSSPNCGDDSADGDDAGEQAPK